MRYLSKIFIILLILSGFFTEAFAKKAGKSKKNRRKPTIQEVYDSKLIHAVKEYRLGKIGSADLWKKLYILSQTQHRMSHNKQISLYVLQASLLLKSGYPVLAAYYGSEAIKKAQNPLSSKLNKTWAMLAKISRARPIQYILEDLAGKVKLKTNPPAFGNDWNYILANYQVNKGNDKEALKFYRKIKLSDRYFMPALYQKAMIHIANNQYNEAETALKTIFHASTKKASPLKLKDRMEIKNYALMALGRLYYQSRRFLDSARSYRKVSKTSPLYYDALFEQSWALFMSGNPRHALGTLYGVHSPYFKDSFNPEGKVLEAIIYYWMCRYEDGRNSLADFAENHAKAIESLTSFLDRQRLNSGTAYQMFEDLVSGVSSESLGVPRSVLKTAAEKDSMLLVRDQLATVIGEGDKLHYKGVFRHKGYTAPLLKKIDSIKFNLRNRLGEQFIEELKNEKANYEELYAQSQFLYLELLMGEKEQLMGGELHSESKVTKISDRANIRGWGDVTQSWKKEIKGEFWWDEIGFHIIDVQPQCNVK